MEMQNFNLVLNVKFVFHESWGTLRFWFVLNTHGKEWLRIQYKAKEFNIKLKTVLPEWKSNNSWGKNITTTQYDGPSRLCTYQLLNRSLKNEKKLRGKFLVLVFSMSWRQTYWLNSWSTYLNSGCCQLF